MNPRNQAPFDRVALVGAGLMGTSVALAARRAWGPRVVLAGYDVKPAARRLARRIGAFDRVTESLAGAVGNAALVVLAVPAGRVVAVATAVDRVAPGEALITDLAGVKRRICLETPRALPAARVFLGGHPLAGKAGGGAASASEDLFDERSWCVCPPARISASGGRLAEEEAAHRLARFITGLGARPVWMTAEAHDRTVAYSSHLVQLVSSALMVAAAREMDPQGLALVSGPVFRDMTRVAASPWDGWRDVLEMNRDETLGALRGFQRVLAEFADLRAPEKLGRLFSAAEAARRAFEAGADAL